MSKILIQKPEDEPDWIIENLKNEKRQIVLDARRALQERLARARDREAKAKQRYANGESFMKRQKTSKGPENQDEGEAEEEFVLDDYESDNEKSTGATTFNELGLSKATQDLMKKLGMGPRDDENQEEAILEGPKVFYCSRTHSQLSQFANELRKIKLPPIVDVEEGNGQLQTSQDDVGEELLKHLTMGSRKNLCINPKVNKLTSMTAINEKCMDLQKSGTSKENKCPYIPNKDNETMVHKFRDHAISKIRDIEDLGNLGKELGICPYYASRAAIPESEIITLPYPLLLQQSAREALNVVLQDHVVVIDEAHNLMDSICGIYSTSITLIQLQKGKEQLIVYLQKFRNRLKGKNRIYVTQIVRVLDSLIGYLQQKANSKATKEGEVQVNDLLSSKGVDQINLYKLDAYIQESRLARKVDGYSVHKAKSEAEKGATPRSTTPVLMQIQSFLMALMNPSSEGRFFYAMEESGVCLSYLLLDAAPHFKSIVSSARAVILAGGTMSPMADYITHLFPYVPSDRIMTLSCGHIIPPENLVVYPISRGPNGESLEFTFEKRSKQEIINAAGFTLLQIITVVPDGVVAFFPSYSYLETCLKAWKSASPPTTHSHHPSLLAAIQSTKPLFTESKGPTTPTPPTLGTQANLPQTESLLSQYTTAIQNPPTSHKGALLLAVLSGSLSEGINFSDALGRCVLVFGLPFPNPHSPTCLAKRAYIEGRASAAAQERGMSKGDAEREGKKAGGEFYLNGTMRAVNQAVGRAIRHRGDYAAVLLVDGRYEGERVASKLPGWMKESVVKGKSVGVVISGLKVFFDGKKKGT